MTMQQRLHRLSLAGGIGRYRQHALRPTLLTQRGSVRYFASNKIKKRLPPKKPVHTYVDEVSRVRLDRPEIKLAQLVELKDRPPKPLRLAMKEVETTRFEEDYKLQKACFKSGDKVNWWNKRVREYYFSGAGIKYTEDRATEYVSNEMGMSWGSTRQVLADLRGRLPHLHVDSMLDFGAGTGSGVWAAADVFGGADGALKEIFCVEAASNMRNIGERLCKPLEHTNTTWFTWLNEVPQQKFPLVLASFVLREIPEKDLSMIVDKLWQACSGALVIVDYGTAAGSASVLEARRQIIENYSSGPDAASLLAPCPHAQTCRWATEYRNIDPHDRHISKIPFCFFEKRIPIKTFPSGSFMYQHEKNGTRKKHITEHPIPFCYVVFCKNNLPKEQDARSGLAATTWSRIVRPVRAHRGHVIIEACLPTGGFKKLTITRAKGRKNGSFTAARFAKWGNLWPDLPELKTPAAKSDEQDGPKDDTSDSVADEEKLTAAETTGASAEDKSNVSEADNLPKEEQSTDSETTSASEDEQSNTSDANTASEGEQSNASDATTASEDEQSNASDANTASEDEQSNASDAAGASEDEQLNTSEVISTSEEERSTPSVETSASEEEQSTTQLSNKTAETVSSASNSSEAKEVESSPDGNSVRCPVSC